MNKAHIRQLKQSFKQYSRSQQDSFEEEAEFARLLPDDGFFAEYMEYTSRQESPGSFHFWVGASVISAVLGRRAWVRKGIYEVYPNIYVVLVAPSGVARKTRAMRLGTDLVEPFEWMNIAADKTTPEALLASLDFGEGNFEHNGSTIDISADSQAFVRTGEMSVFLNKASYTQGMITLLTDLFDCPNSFVYKTRTQKSLHLTNVALTFLGATTPDWLATNTPEEAFEGGFMSRVVFVFKGNRDRNFPIPEEPAPGQVEKLQKMIKEIRQNFKGNIQLTTQAQEFYEEYYRQVHGEYTEQNNEKLGGFIERKPDTLMKLATILSAAENPYDKTITKQHMKQASHLLQATQARMFNAFAKVDRSRLGVLQDKILDILQNNGPCTRRQLLRKLGRNVEGVRQLEEAMTILVESGYVKEDVVLHKNGQSASVYTPVEEKIIDTRQAN